MKQMYLPTLAEMREMLGEDLYVKFIWMWREQEQDARAEQRRAKLLGAITQREAAAMPSPMFVRVEPEPEPLPARTLAALLRPPVARLRDTAPASDLDNLIEQVRPQSNEADDEPREALVVAASGRRRRR
jgi:hypothetical protein